MPRSCKPNVILTCSWAEHCRLAKSDVNVSTDLLKSNLTSAAAKIPTFRVGKR